MRRILLSVFIGLLGVGFTAADVQAKRLGGGMSQGMKRQAPPPQSPQQGAAPQAPAQQAAPTSTGATAAAAANPARRSWMGPIAGLAAGLGIAALLSHFGLGEGLANILTMILLAAAAVFLVRWALRRFGPKPAAQPAGMRYAGAGAPADAWSARTPADASGAPSAGGASAGGGGAFGGVVPADRTPAALSAAPAAVPAGFDRAEFERAAKMIFVRLQAANDAGDLEDLRQFSTPEMFAAFRVDLQDRQGTQRTDVVKLDADLLEVATEGERQIVSVRFHGLIREETDGAAAPFDEVWHLVRPADGSRPWAIAGIQQTADAAH